eukprot:873398-Rhodomonas_salina.4
MVLRGSTVTLGLRIQYTPTQRFTARGTTALPAYALPMHTPPSSHALPQYCSRLSAMETPMLQYQSSTPLRPPYDMPGIAVGYLQPGTKGGKCRYQARKQYGIRSREAVMVSTGRCSLPSKGYCPTRRPLPQNEYCPTHRLCARKFIVLRVG